MKFLKFWFPVVVYCCIIFGASAVPSVEMPSRIPHMDKLVHGIEYGILAFLVARAVSATNSNASIPLVFSITIFFVVFYGITDEFHQSFVQGRSSDLQDLMADTVGGALVAIIYLFTRKKHNSNV